MRRTVIYGNSGSGKSTLAGRLAKQFSMAYLDLDDIAWEASGVRKEIPLAIEKLHAFIAAHPSWVIEGCYGSLIEEAAKSADELIFLNPGIEACQENCRSRPWEPHKYDTKEDQDRNLTMLLRWVANYETRRDEFSLQTHERIFKAFSGKKRELKSNLQVQTLD